MSTISLPDWRAGGHYFSHDGRTIFFRDDGPRDAPALLLIHGFPTASWDWQALWPALVPRFRTICLDMLGFGWSAKPRDHAYRIADQADLQEALLRRLDIDACDVLAHDYGDTVAQELLARRIDAHDARPAIRSVCFLNGGLFPEAHRAAFVQKLLLSPAGGLVARLTGRRALTRNMRRIFGSGTPPDAEHLDGFWTLINHNDGRAVLPRLIRYIAERRAHRERWVGALRDTRTPLKLICGASDPISGAQMAQRYHELVPAANVTLLEGIGHYPALRSRARLSALSRRRRRIVGAVCWWGLGHSCCRTVRKLA